MPNTTYELDEQILAGIAPRHTGSVAFCDPRWVLEQ